MCHKTAVRQARNWTSSNDNTTTIARRLRSGERKTGLTVVRVIDELPLNSALSDTDAYRDYVAQFERWEEDVVRRRASLRQQARDQLIRQAKSAILLEKRRLEAEDARRQRVCRVFFWLNLPTLSQEAERLRAGGTPPVPVSPTSSDEERMRNAEAEEATENAVQMMTNERGSGVPAFGMEVSDDTSSTY